MIEHMNVIDTLSDQITALLDLMQCANDSADISSIRVASEMCLTMHDELMGEVDKMSKEIKEQEKSKVIEILKEQDKGAEEMTYHKEEYTLHNGQKIYVQYDDHNICQVTKECIEMLLDLYQQGRADAIDEFVKKICKKYTEEERKGNYKQYCGEIKQNIADIAEQLKINE